jgi:RNA polymerase subunit RPABC4/transcription elongation factor Spt4
MELDEVTIGAIGIFLIVLILIGAFIGWQRVLLTVGAGAALGLGSAIALERKKRLGRLIPPTQSTELRSCPSCKKTIAKDHVLCPLCFVDLKKNCRECGAIVDVEARSCPQCRSKLPPRDLPTLPSR